MANCVFEHDFKCIAVAEYLLFQNQGGYLTQKKVKKKLKKSDQLADRLIYTPEMN